MPVAHPVQAIRQKRLKPGRVFTVLGNMCKHVGWKYKGVVDKLEVARKQPDPASVIVDTIDPVFGILISPTLSAEDRAEGRLQENIISR